MKILIADDSKFMRFQLRKICEEFSPEIIEEAGTGIEAIRKCEKINPDLIFMDITMPQMDGVEATKIIKERWPEQKLIICSAIAESRHVKETLAMGADEIIKKPFSKEEIVNAVKKLMAK